MTNEKTETAGRELVLTRLIEAPVELVWEVFTEPEHIEQWFGPDGYTTKVAKMDVRTGGEWDLTISSPSDPSDYHHECIYLEVVKHKKIVFELRTDFKHVATILFESSGNKTFLTWQMLFESREYFEEVVKKFGIDSSHQQTADKLVAYLSQKTSTK
jgi:uncharacterized protein YndB with AHSA1/START domain